MAARPKEFICKCFYSRNIFLQKYKLHVTFNNEEQFYKEFRQELQMKGCATAQQYETVLSEIKKEVSRRGHFHQDAFERYLTISDIYHPLHPHLWHFKRSFLDNRLSQIVGSLCRASNKEEAESTLIQNGGNVIGSLLYRIPVFSTEFCSQLAEELSHFEDSPCPKGRPNTMSNYGISLDEMGLSEGLLIPLIVEYIQPLSDLLFGQWCRREKCDSFKAFSVLYGPGKDRNLSMHFDNAEVTLNICLSSEFDGGELEFGSLWNDTNTQLAKETVMHQMGTGVLHLGQHTHQALPIISGTRCNLIVWMRNSAIRNECCKMCGLTPDLAEVPFAGDGFTQQADQASGHCAAL